MAQNCYSIEKHHNRWTVSVFGVKVLICDSKKMALAVVRQAMQGPMSRSPTEQRRSVEQGSRVDQGSAPRVAINTRIDGAGR
jgi:hypothetical protein